MEVLKKIEGLLPGQQDLWVNLGSHFIDSALQRDGEG
jgi:hypothetical protein